MDGQKIVGAGEDPGEVGFCGIHVKDCRGCLPLSPTRGRDIEKDRIMAGVIFIQKRAIVNTKIKVHLTMSD